MNSSATETMTSNHWQEYKDRWNFEGTGEEAIRFVGGMAGYEAHMQHDFMLSRGLKPEHRFLDLACGCLRGTIRLVDYLNDGNFYGADISIGLLKEGLMECDRLKLKKLPFVQLIHSFDLDRMFINKFDYILSVSLVTHLYPEDIPGLFRGIKSVLAKNGEAYITIYPLAENDADNYRGDVHLMWYKQSWLANEAKKQGIHLVDLPERIPNRLPRGGTALIPVVNSNLAQWVLKGTHAN